MIVSVMVVAPKAVLGLKRPVIDCALVSVTVVSPRVAGTVTVTSKVVTAAGKSLVVGRAPILVKTTVTVTETVKEGAALCECAAADCSSSAMGSG